MPRLVAEFADGPLQPGHYRGVLCVAELAIAVRQRAGAERTGRAGCGAGALPQQNGVNGDLPRSPMTHWQEREFVGREWVTGSGPRLVFAAWDSPFPST